MDTRNRELLMADYQWADIEGVKSGQYSARAITTDEFDAVLDQLNTDITAQMISYLSNDDIDPDAPSIELVRACTKQVSYEFKRLEDIGLSSITFPNGSVNKMSVDEWLPDVKKILERNRYYAI
jgi:hypothetical protein